MGAADRYYLLLLLIVLVGTLGAVLIVLFLGAWRRNILRQRRIEERSASGGTGNVDIWRTSAERVAPSEEDAED